jgi:hypothetical protein
MKLRTRKKIPLCRSARAHRREMCSNYSISEWKVLTFYKVNDFANTISHFKVSLCHSQIFIHINNFVLNVDKLKHMFIVFSLYNDKKVSKSLILPVNYKKKIMKLLKNHKMMVFAQNYQEKILYDWCDTRIINSIGVLDNNFISNCCQH